MNYYGITSFVTFGHAGNGIGSVVSSGNGISVFSPLVSKVGTCCCNSEGSAGSFTTDKRCRLAGNFGGTVNGKGSDSRSNIGTAASVNQYGIVTCIGRSNAGNGISGIGSPRNIDPVLFPLVSKGSSFSNNCERGTVAFTSSNRNRIGGDISKRIYSKG